MEYGAGLDDRIPLCTVCTQQLRGWVESGSVEKPFNCALCFGMLDEKFVDEVVAEAKKIYESSGYDSKSFLLAVNVPVTAIFREALYELAYRIPLSDRTFSTIPFKLRIVNAYLEKIRNSTGLSPSLSSDLILTLTFINDEFNKSDVAYLMKKIYKMASPSALCNYTISFERSPLFIAGRYCKFSRNMSQSPCSALTNMPKIIGHSVSEKIGAPFVKETRCDIARFVASGREDIDVRMLGSGRPFVLQLINPKKIFSFQKHNSKTTLKRLEDNINKNHDVKVLPGLKQITSNQASLIKNGQDERRKLYTGYCYSTRRLDDLMLKELRHKAPFENGDASGTYVKEFVHGDFGRTRPSLADLFGVEHGEIDILELDVEGVDMEWPPK
ncbi:hypothetical protein DINM_005358 [Dirofilaria immitis]|nr:hypothetical protein [Dirofilaria immitis]